MKQQHGPNERIKHHYYEYLAAVNGNGEASIDAVAKALHVFETYTGFKDFKAFHTGQAIGFKKHLAGQKNRRTKEPLSSATIYSTLAALKAFFQWLSGKRGYKSRLREMKPIILTLPHAMPQLPKLAGKKPCRLWTKSGTS